MRLLTVSLMTALLLTACSDDSTPIKTPDKKLVGGDGVAAREASTTPREKGVTTEAGAAKESCKQIGECAKLCGTDIAVCVPACTAKGCPTAQAKFATLSQCAVAKCLNDCTGGFNDKCNTCAAAACKTEYDGCQNDVCP